MKDKDLELLAQMLKQGKSQEQMDPVIQRLLTDKVNFEQNVDYMLHNAFMYGSTAIIEQIKQAMEKLLINNDFTREAFEDNFGTMLAEDGVYLTLAAERGHTPVVDMLLGYAAVRNKAAGNANFALRRAARNGHSAVVQTLLRNETVRAAFQDNSAEVFNEAVISGNLKLVTWLLEQEGVIGKLQNTTGGGSEALFNAIVYRHPTVAAKLLEHRIGLNDRTQIIVAIREAASKGYLAIVKKLLDHDSIKGDVHVTMSAFEVAASGGQLEIVNFFLQDTTIASNNECVARALRGAASGGHLPVVEKLLGSCDVKLEVFGDVLGSALTGNNIAVVEKLLQYDVLVDRFVKGEDFLRTLESGNANTHIVARLLENPVILAAVRKNYKQIFAVLIAYNCSSNLHLLADKLWPNGIKDVPQEYQDQFKKDVLPLLQRHIETTKEFRKAYLDRMSIPDAVPFNGLVWSNINAYADRRYYGDVATRDLTFVDTEKDPQKEVLRVRTLMEELGFYIAQGKDLGMYAALKVVADIDRQRQAHMARKAKEAKGSTGTNRPNSDGASLDESEKDPKRRPER